MNASPQLQYIDTAGKLQALSDQLVGSQWLVLDTEFLRERTYYPKFCLLQIATDDLVACIDPLALEELDPLFEILYDRSITKVFHSGRQDLEIFYNLRGELPGPIFDTQIAAPLLGFSDQVGYATLVAELLGVSLNKAHTRTDWTRRPLSDDQLRYAADDVIYLSQAYQAMHEQLVSLERLDWLQEEFNALTDPALYRNRPEDAWRRIRAATALSGGRLSVLQALAQWREETAKREDRPRSWLMKEDTMIDLARLQPKDPETLKTTRGVPERTMRRYQKELCTLIADAAQRPPVKNEKNSKPTRKTPEQEALMDALNSVVRLRAAQHSLNPSLLASKKDLEQLVTGNDQNRMRHGWRYHIVGKELLAMLRGQRTLSVVDGRLYIGPAGPATAEKAPNDR
jgi:ribonuclease D